LAPGDAIFNRVNNSVHSNFADGYNVFVQTQKQKGMELIEEEGWVSFEYTKKEPRPAFRYRIKKENKTENVRFVTFLAPYKKEIPKVEIEIREGLIKDSQTFELNVNGKKRKIEYSL
jgi:heparan-sulfate lyase